MMRPHPLLPLLAASALVACGGSTQLFSEDDGGGGSAAGGGGSAPISCDLPAAGADFTFTVRNVGMRALGLSFACGTTMPIFLQTPEGERGIGPGNASFCEVACEQVYDGYENWGCSDCGPGVGESLLPGNEITIVWDRRYYVGHTAPSACSGNEEGNDCSMGVLARAADITSGRLEVCTSSDPSGYCWEGDVEVVPFTIDLTTDGLVIEVD